MYYDFTNNLLNCLLSLYLKCEEDGQMFLSLDDGATKFTDLIQLVEFYTLNRGVLPCKLKHPCTTVALWPPHAWFWLKTNTAVMCAVVWSCAAGLEESTPQPLSVRKRENIRRTIGTSSGGEKLVRLNLPATCTLGRIRLSGQSSSGILQDLQSES